MDKEEATAYLERKGQIKGRTTYTKKEQALIKKVQKEGKIFGDPCFEIA